MQPAKKNIAAIYGLIAGLALILLTVILYLSGPSAFLGGAAYIGHVIVLGAAVAAPLVQKKTNGGYLEFRDALKSAFIVMVITLALQSVFTFVLMNYIDSGFRQTVETAILDRTEKWLIDAKMSQDKVDELMAREKGVNQFAFTKTLMGLAVSYIVCFIVALIIAAIVKKKAPEFKESEF